MWQHISDGKLPWLFGIVAKSAQIAARRGLAYNAATQFAGFTSPMSRRIAIRFMLSLLLLLSQQMALSHAMSHWAGNPHVQQSAEEDSRLSAAIAQDQSCDQCLSFAQLAGAVGADTWRFAVPGAAEAALPGPAARGPWIHSHPAFQPRAPPVLA
jgi:hypothetical protein